MGVRGLTTFINSNSDAFFVEFKLNRCTLVIDGNSLAAVLYSETLGPYSAFGGDYDFFAEKVENFIQNLKRCEVEPVFIFDGGYEQKKATTVRKRNSMKVYAIEKVTPNRSTRDFFPLMLRPVLQERLIELGVTCLQSDFEADREIAAVSKRLNAPVLSNDSDFFIFDIPFIPLSTFPFDVCQSSSESNVHCFIQCQIFYVDNFLKSYGGLEKSMLPLLATVLGNDYLQRSVFKNFYGLIKIEKSKKLTLGQRRIGGLIRWLKKESFDSALKKILSSLPKNYRQRIRSNINSIITGYSDLSTCLDEYLPCSTNLPGTCNKICSQLKELSIAHQDMEANESYSESENNVEEGDEEYLDSLENSQKELSGDEKFGENYQISTKQSSPVSYCNNLETPQWFLERSRRCQMAPQIMTLITLNTYFCVPQVEDCRMPHAGEVGLPILRIIAGLVLGTNSLRYWYRLGSSEYRCKIIEPSNCFKLGELPELFALNEVSFDYRKNILLDTLKLERPEFLDSYPEDWRLLLLCLIYWIKSKDTLIPCHIHAVVFMLIAVNIFQEKIGFFRKTKLFIRKYGAKLKSLEKIRENVAVKFDNEIRDKSMNQLLSEVTKEDCLLVFQNILSDFSVDCGLKERPRNFSRTLIHCFAELQTILDLGQNLNLLLLQPFKRIIISKFYNGTFLYNVATNLKRQPDIINYLEKLFKKSPIILKLHMFLYTELAQFTNWTVTESRKLCRKRHKKRQGKAPEDSSGLEEVNEEDNSFYDVNNKFSLLLETKH
ncbi:single-strand DNA endonuclease protein asteroid [Rhodnius prolixus]|uniref:single-strand DNA endonuclease protein asteroid n=1 Tax=Rhodnius prolixus TaxID=13249 RepID=UPI003D188523